MNINRSKSFYYNEIFFLYLREFGNFIVKIVGCNKNLIGV